MAEFKMIETQEELDRILSERLSREKDKALKNEESLKGKVAELEKSLAEATSKFADQEKIISGHKDEVAKLTTELNAQTIKATKHQIAHEFGLPFELADRLNGDSEESLKKDAEALKKFVAPKTAAPLANPETPPSDDKEAAYRNLAKNIFK